jgi:hypothetical protein
MTAKPARVSASAVSLAKPPQAPGAARDSVAHPERMSDAIE